MGNKYLIVIAGPTAVGKTGVAIHLAKSLGGDIISADSRQIYRELNIGTAKPTPEERKTIRHHLVDTHSIHETINAGKYAALAEEIIQDLFKKHDRLFLVGGTGLYIRALLDGLHDLPPAHEEIRQKWAQILKEQGIASLQQRLHEVDPDYYQQVDLQNPVRLVRALEVFEVTGIPYSSHIAKPALQRKLSWQNIKIGLTMDREQLYDRINRRMDAMISEGLFDEAKSLYAYREHQALQTVGYQEIFPYLEGKYSREEAVQLLKKNSRNYAKRQLTWFRKDKEYQWFQPGQLQEMLSLIRSFSGSDTQDFHHTE